MTTTRTRWTREVKLSDEQLSALPKRNATYFHHPALTTDLCAVCGEQLGDAPSMCSYGTSPADAADDRRTGWYHRDHSRALEIKQENERRERDAWEREQLASILERGGLITLGTREARQAWNDGIPELVSAIMRHFTDEERAVLMAGIV